MSTGPNIARVGALLGDNARAQMLSSLMQGKALTANELARVAGITPQTASSHLNKLVSGQLICVRKQGRHKYFTLADREVASMLEAMMGIAAVSQLPIVDTGPKDLAMRKARVCYNHLAGHMATRMFDSLVANQYLLVHDGSLQITEPGQQFILNFGIDLVSLQTSRSPLCRECLDWSERRSHLAGSLGRALFARLEDLRWLRRQPDSRTVIFTAKGKSGFARTFTLP